MAIRKLREAEPRIETGVVQFGADWPGVFIRGDQAQQFASRLRLLAEDENIGVGILDELAELLESCHINKQEKS
jgi:hypothetical protein